MDTVLKGGTVTTVEGQCKADIGIEGGHIVEIAPSLSSGGARLIDASNCLVLPGAIDVHTHFADDSDGPSTADNYVSGSLAAAFGGISTFVNYAFQRQGERLLDTIERERAKAAAGVYTDYGFHIVVTDLSVDGILDELASLAARGVTSVKVFTTVAGCRLHDHEIMTVLAAARELGLLVTVHAEEDCIVQQKTTELIQRGDVDVRFLPIARSDLAEAVAVARVAGYAMSLDMPVYFVHLSSARALGVIRYARSCGAHIFVETRPAYLFLDEEQYRLPDGQGRRYVCWPPLRKLGDRDALWAGIANGEVQVYGTDHTTWMLREKMEAGLRFDQIPAGFSNVETSLAMLYSEGVAKNRISIGQLVAVTSTNPARLFGLWPQKGAITIGSDADLVVFDPTLPFEVTSSRMHSRSKSQLFHCQQGEQARRETRFSLQE